MTNQTKRQAPYPLRLQPDISQWVKEQAKQGDRSMNAEINRLLRSLKEQAQSA